MAKCMQTSNLKYMYSHSTTEECVYQTHTDVSAIHAIDLEKRNRTCPHCAYEYQPQILPCLNAQKLLPLWC